MVNKKILEKLSNPELENYLKPDSRFVPDAIQYAFDILKTRGRVFTDEDTERINQMLLHKNRQEKEYHNQNKGWDRNVTEDENAIELYSDRLIWIFSIFFGAIFGAVLQGINFLIIGKKNLFYMTILAGIIYTVFQVYLIELLSGYFKSTSFMALFFSGIGATLLNVLREKVYPDNLQYRKKSFAVPLIIAMLIYIPLFYIIISGL